MKKTISLTEYSVDKITSLCGIQDSNLKILEQEYQLQITFRGDAFYVVVHDEQLYLKFDEVMRSLLALLDKGIRVSKRDVVYAIKLQKQNSLDNLQQLYDIAITKTNSGKMIYPKTIGQKGYYLALKKKDVVFAMGSAGTGKTYLAVVFAVDALKKNLVKKIILTRPAVEAGESLGFLPGDLKEKVDPYLRPLYDALHDMLGVEQTERLIEKGVIEIAPLAYMRGRTLEDAYVILDEAQNTTENQMKMFLTRLGFNSKMIITGDESQVDLPKGVKSGLISAYYTLQGVKGIEFIKLTALDVVRHPVVQRIIERYQEKETNKSKDTTTL